MKIAIIEDSCAYNALASCFKQLGHEVIGERIEGNNSLGRTLQVIGEAKPDIILLDHDLGIYEVTGKTVMAQLDPELCQRVVGISIEGQPYCRRAPFSKNSCSIGDIEGFVANFKGAA